MQGGWGTEARLMILAPQRALGDPGSKADSALSSLFLTPSSPVATPEGNEPQAQSVPGRVGQCCPAPAPGTGGPCNRNWARQFSTPEGGLLGGGGGWKREMPRGLPGCQGQHWVAGPLPRRCPACQVGLHGEGRGAPRSSDVMVPRRGRKEEGGRRDEGTDPGHWANRKGEAASLAGQGESECPHCISLPTSYRELASELSAWFLRR